MSSNQLSGIDVSKWQGTVNWKSVQQAGITFAFTRATYGISEIDASFNDNWSGMQEAGIIRGAYHFFLAADDPTEQAEFFIRTVGKLGPQDLPPVIDVEAGGGVNRSLAANVQTWLTAVEQGLGRTPVIYTAPSFWNENLTGGFGRYALWVAEYGVTSPRAVNGWSNWTFWQYSSTGTVNGVSNSVDLDKFSGTEQDLAVLIKSSVASQPQA
jgi:lysozyme